MSVTGELSAETNGVVTVISADGSHVRWDLVDAEAALAGTSMTSGDLARVGDMLSKAGVLVSVEETGRRLLDLGATRSLLGRIFAGSSSIRPRAPFRLWALQRQSRRHRSFQ